MNATEITVIGNVVNSPTSVRTQGGKVTNFRLAATERRYDSTAQAFVNGNTFFIDVECWSDLAGNVSHSVSKGDPVVVVGTIRTDQWETDDGQRSKPRIKARAVAPNLAWGTTDFKKMARSSAAAQAEEGPEPAEPPAEDGFGDLAGIRAGEDYVTGADALGLMNPDPEPALA